MGKYVFVGDYETTVELPDGSTVLVQPGETRDLPFPEPGPLWSSTPKKKADS